MKRLDQVVAGLIVLLVALSAVLWVITGKGDVDPRKGYSSPLIERAVEMGYFPCEHEDSVGPCYWDASTRGNGAGRTFVVTDDNEVFYE